MIHLSSISLFSSSSWKTQGSTLFSSSPTERLSGTKIFLLNSRSFVNHESLSSVDVVLVVKVVVLASVVEAVKVADIVEFVEIVEVVSCNHSKI